MFIRNGCGHIRSVIACERIHECDGRDETPATTQGCAGRAQPPGSSTRLRARYAITLARLAHRSEQYRLVRPAEVSMNTPEQGAAWHTPNRSMPSSVSRTARPIAAPAAYLSDTEPLSV